MTDSSQHSSWSTAKSISTNSQPFSGVGSAVDRNSKVFRENYAKNSAAWSLVQDAQQQANMGGGEKYQQRHLERGRMLPRQRIETLLDQDSYFLEIASLAGHGIS